MNSLLKEAISNEQGSAKMAWFGPQGSGKTMSAVQTAIGLSRNFHKDAPIAFFDTEKGSDFARPICDAEGIKLLRVKSRAFSDLLETLKEAEQQGACSLIVDSMSHVWTEIMDSFCRQKKISRIEFQHWRELKAVWREWVDLMLNSRLHVLICGRAGKEYAYEENEQGKKELITTGTKFKAEGEFGYEPDVLVELWNEREEGSRRGSHLIHKGIVLKDRAWGLNGREFAWKDRNAYKKSDFQLVYKCFEPYFKFLSIGGEHHAIDAERSSDAMFAGPNGDSSGYVRAKLKQACLEDWDATMELLFPGTSGAMKRNRAVVGEAITGVRSRTRLEQYDVNQLQQCVGILMAFEHRFKLEPQVEEGSLLALLELAKEDFRGASSKGTTLLELTLAKSVEQVKANGQDTGTPGPF
jgi:AAA domain-containing protein